MAKVEILLPTYQRLQSLIMTLTGIAAQTVDDINVIVADQNDSPSINSQVVQSLVRIIEATKGSVEWFTRKTNKGIAEQRDFLLKKSSAPYVLYLDDDIFMQPWVVAQMLSVLEEQNCGFVGAFPAGLSFKDDVRPEQQKVEYWDGPIRPEVVEPDSPEWERWHLHRAANIFHLAQANPQGGVRLYKVAWISMCILYDREKLLAVGGFSFWNRLPRYHSGEEVLVQNLLMRRWGGCGILPSGTYSSQVPSTVLNKEGTVDGHALELLPEMIEQYAPESRMKKKSLKTMS